MGRRNALGTFVRDGDAGGGGGTPRLWGVSSELCLLRLCSFCLFFRFSQLLGLLVCVYLCLLALWSALSFNGWVSGLERVVGSYGVLWLVCRQAVCDIYVLHRSGRANLVSSFLTSGFLAISEQVPPPEQGSTLGTSGYASLSDKVERGVPQGKTDDIEDKKCVQTKLSITFVFSHNIYKSIPYHLSIAFPINSNNPPLIFSKPTKQYQ